MSSCLYAWPLTSSNLQVRLAGPCNSPQLRALSYYIIVFPSIHVCLNYPLNIQPIANNIYSVLTGQDCCKQANERCNWTLMFLIRLFAAITPISIAFGISNLVVALQYSSLSGFVLCFIFPAALQLQSIRVCKRTFSGLHTEQTAASKEQNCEIVLQERKPKKESSLYMTPYSNAILSHPITVVVLGAVMFILFLASILSLFLFPVKMTCVVAS